MELRIFQEKNEEHFLSQFATMNINSRGRLNAEEKCDIRTDFQRDRDRIIHSKAFRRLKDKTQVFFSPSRDHLRTRLTHTLEVSQISRTIARALRLNEDLTEAIALGHDLGHTPFGHAGEYALNKLSKNGFRHNEQSLRVVEKIEKNGEGLNLTFEVRDGILCHRTGSNPATPEGRIVQLSDKIAYLNHDIDDAIRAGVLKISEIPESLLNSLGKTGGTRINTMIHAVVECSLGKNNVYMNEDVKKDMYKLRDFLFEKVYLAENRRSERKKVEHIIKELYNHYINEGQEELEAFSKTHSYQNENIETIVCDYISGMTDRYAIKQYTKIFLPPS